MEWFKNFIDIIFGAGLIINAFLFIPQAIRIYRLKDAKDLSLITFIGFCLIQTSAIAYGFFHKDYILMYGYAFSLFTCGIVTYLGIYYRLIKTKV